MRGVSVDGAFFEVKFEEVDRRCGHQRVLPDTIVARRSCRSGLREPDLETSLQAIKAAVNPANDMVLKHLLVDNIRQQN